MARLERDLEALTPTQRQAVDAPTPALCILAGAGSGKTRVLTLRVARRIDDGSAAADHTVVCTFTRRAASELRSRLRAYGVPTALGTGAPAGGVPPGAGVRLGTLHQLALSLLRRRAADTGQAPPRLVEHRHRVLQSITGDPGAAAVLGGEIGWAKSRCLGPGEYGDAALRAGRRAAVAPAEVADGYRAYEEALRRRRAIDLDDVLLAATDLVTGDPAFGDNVRWRYRHLAVDEFQDVNPAQFGLLRAVLSDRDDLTVVGDPDQAVYGWNGADRGLILRLPELLPTMEVVRLAENHRSTPQIVTTASDALGRVGDAPRATRPAGPRPVVRSFADDTAEADGVAAVVAEWAASGRSWSDIAVLARTNDQLSTVAAALRRTGIPFRTAPGRESPVDEAPASGAGAGAGTRTGEGTGSGSGTRSGVGPATGAESGAGGDVVELVTFHRAKGLEWEAVCVIGLEDGLVPIAYAATPEERDEERRLLYVALTRAEDELCCTWAAARRSSGGRLVERAPSPWLDAVGLHAGTAVGGPRPVDTARRFADLRSALGG